MESLENKVFPSRYVRGSEWRRWDLHVHTPHSALNNGFGDDFEAFAKALFEKAIDKQIAVIGITDYFLIDGYRELRELQQDQSRLAIFLVLKRHWKRKEFSFFQISSCG